MTGAGAAQPDAQAWRTAAWLPWAVALGAGAIAAVWVAHDAGVAGLSAVPVVVRVGLASVAVFLVCGYAPAVLSVPFAPIEPAGTAAGNGGAEAIEPAEPAPERAAQSRAA